MSQASFEVFTPQESGPIKSILAINRQDMVERRLMNDIDEYDKDLELVDRNTEANNIDHMRDIVLRNDELYTVKLYSKENLNTAAIYNRNL